MWSGRGGKELSKGSASQAVARALRRAGIEDATLHDLRRSCGSTALAKDVPLLVVSRHLGHATPHVTARVYAHLLEDAQLAAVAAIFEEAFAARSEGAFMAAGMAATEAHP